ncbi:hypothetical protein I6N96_07945 [Enterococcus sp. BWM-S5]|uniref:Uncharacterized protein n=1 Tax=Enterococcus larvae TaxID=2794352 RepID=A0ABS4CIE4_9ENTE|nr:hypothetical protein [Enterococcus larvae]MBP1046213.1 hypothetical protein [Enterococcus larvae]
MNKKLRLKVGFALFSVLFFSVISAFLTNNASYAIARPANEAEQATLNYANSPIQAGTPNNYGAIWATGSPSEAWNMHINVNSNATSVPIYIRGSVYSRGQSQQVFAVRIKDDGSQLPITGIPAYPNNRIYRGHTSVRPWTAESVPRDNHMRATMNISSIPQDGKTHKRILKLYRCFSTDGINVIGVNGVCNTQEFPVYVTRPNPVNWSSSRKSYISTNKTAVNGTNGESNPLTVTAGQTLYFRHRSDVSGTGVDYSLNVNGKGARLDSFNNPLIWQNSTINNVKGFYQISPYAGDNGSYTSYTTNKDDIGRTICQKMWVSKTAHNAGQGDSAWACAKVEAEPWQLSLKTEIKGSFSGNNTYQNKNITTQVGETLNWKHTATNNTNYIAPADGANKHGYGTLGYNLLYAQNAKPTNGVASPETHWVRDTINTPNINKNGGSYSYEASKSAFNASAGISGIYSFNNNGKPPTHYTIKSNDAGKNFCQRQYAGRIKDGGNESWSDWRCAYVSYDYEIKPCLESPDNSCGGTDIPVTPGEKKDPPIPTIDPSGKTKPTDWIVSTWTVPASKEGISTPGGSVWASSGEFKNTDDVCSAVYPNTYGISKTESNCTIIKRDKGSFDAGKQLFEGIIKKPFEMPEDAELGSRICFGFSISPYKLTAGESESEQNNKTLWRHATPHCFIAAKKPKMQVWGGSVYSGTNIQTNKTNFSTGTFGSWVEYASISKGTINSFTSGANNNSNKLTMANKGTTLGKYGEIPTDNLASKIKDRYNSPAATSTSMTCSNVSDGKVCKQKETTTEVKVPAQMNPSEPSRTVILDATNKSNPSLDQNVYIDRDILANTTLGKASDAQAFIIIAKNIYIHPDVTNIDAWLLASDSVVTCANPSKSGTNRKDMSFVSDSNCGKPLRINGPVQTKNLNSWRTNGSMLNTAADPAEVYNLRADTYLWAASKGSGDGRFITTYTRELSPRF